LEAIAKQQARLLFTQPIFFFPKSVVVVLDWCGVVLLD